MDLKKKILDNRHFEVQVDDLNLFIEDQFNQHFDFNRDQRNVSGVNCLFEISKDDEGYEFQAKKLAEFKLSGYHNDLIEILLGNLARRGIIPVGKYMIIT